MSEKETGKPPISDTGESKKKAGINIHFTLSDLMGFGVRLVKSGLSLTRSLEEAIDLKLDEMVKKGQYTREEADKASQKLKTDLNQGIHRFTGRLSDGVKSTLNRLNIATLDDMKSLEKRLDSLIEEIGKLDKKSTGNATTAPKPPAKSSPPKTATKSSPKKSAATSAPKKPATKSASIKTSADTVPKPDVKSSSKSKSRPVTGGQAKKKPAPTKTDAEKSDAEK